MILIESGKSPALIAKSNKQGWRPDIYTKRFHHGNQFLIHLRKNHLCNLHSIFICNTKTVNKFRLHTNLANPAADFLTTAMNDDRFVGEVTKVEPKILEDLQEKDFLPIIFPVGYDDEFATYNINADDAACAIAEAVHAEKLAFLSDIEGVYKDKDDPSSLISELHVDEAQKLIDDGYVGGGMIPKLKNCIDAIEEGVNRVHILDGRIPHSLLLEIFTNKGIGTAILREDGEKYYNEHE